MLGLFLSQFVGPAAPGLISYGRPNSAAGRTSGAQRGCGRQVSQSVEPAASWSGSLRSGNSAAGIGGGWLAVACLAPESSSQGKSTQPNPLVKRTRNGMRRKLGAHALRACRAPSLRRTPLRAVYQKR